MTNRLILACALVIGGLAVAAPASAQSHSCAVRAYAHRGTYRGGTHTENTLPAFLAVIGMGGHGLETDLRITKDGHFVFMHDKGVHRTTDGTGFVDQMTIAQIEALHANDGGRVPTLEQALTALQPKHVKMLIEVKPSSRWTTKAYERLSRMVTRLGMARRVMLNAGSVAGVDAIVAGTDLRVLWKHIGQPDPTTVAAHADGAITRPTSPAWVRSLHRQGLTAIARQYYGAHPRQWWSGLNRRRPASRPDGLVTGHIDSYAGWCSN